MLFYICLPRSLTCGQPSKRNDFFHVHFVLLCILCVFIIYALLEIARWTPFAAIQIGKLLISFTINRIKTEKYNFNANSIMICCAYAINVEDSIAFRWRCRCRHNCAVDAATIAEKHTHTHELIFDFRYCLAFYCCICHPDESMNFHARIIR